MDTILMDTLRARFMLFLVVLTVVLYGVVCFPNTQNKENTGYIESEKSSSVKSVWKLSKEDNGNQVYSDFIDILQKLNVLTMQTNTSTCITLDKIVKQNPLDVPGSNSREVGITLFFIESTFPKLSSTSAQNTNVRAEDSNSKRTVCNTVINNSNFVPISQPDSMSMKQGTGYHINDTESKGDNKTGVFIPPLANGSGKRNEKQAGLSKTQVIVIVTCAVVLGTLFLIAGALRVHSFMKRYRASRETAVNGQRSNSGMGVNGSNLSTGNLRRDSSSSKASRQSNAVVKVGSDLHVNQGMTDRSPLYKSHSSSPVHSNDHRPLLPTGSNKLRSDGGSSHGSLTFIDEEAQSRIKVTKEASYSDIELESDDDPLLRKSPDSGSSIDAVMTDVYKNTQPSEDSVRDIFEPGGDRKASVSANGNEVGNCECDMVDIERDKNASMVNSDVNADEDTSKVDIDTVNGTQKSAQQMNDNSPESCSVQNCIEPDFSKMNDISEVENEVKANIANSFAVTIGLNQSIGSITSNPSYCYGNQSEYALNGNYGYVAYFSPYCNDNECAEYNAYNNETSGRIPFMLSAGDIINRDREGGECVNVVCNDTLQLNDVGRRASSNSVSPGDVSNRSLSLSNDSSGEPLLKTYQHSRTPSGEYTPLSGKDNMALIDSAEEEPRNGSSPCMVVSQIVPLALYHKSSP